MKESTSSVNIFIYQLKLFHQHSSEQLVVMQLAQEPLLVVTDLNQVKIVKAIVVHQVKVVTKRLMLALELVIWNS